jgi:ATP-dependent Clp protease ATP-binding subunit ClpA
LSQETLDQFHTDDLKLSFVLFDEVEKASDALWNLLLGILDKATLTLGDNRQVDFSRTMIFLTSNLGAAEMQQMLAPRLGFSTGAESADADAEGKMSRAGVEAARRKFTPEFLNRLDAIVSFKPLGDAELRRILELEIEAVCERAPSVCVTITEAAKSRLLKEGTDLRYGARHLKRAVERRLVSPISNLLATGQLQAGDRLVVDSEAGVSTLLFFKETPEGIETGAEAAASAA